MLRGSWAVRVEPPVWVWKRSIQLLGSLAPNSSRMMRAQSLRAARNLAASSKMSPWAVKKKESLGAKRSTSRPRPKAART